MPNVFNNVAQLGSGGVFQTHAALVEPFVDFDRGFLHHRVGILRATTEDEIIPFGDAGMAIFGIEGQTQHASLVFAFDSSHE